jgi:hypothetical protein
MPGSGRASVPDVHSGEGTFSSSARPAIILAMNTNSKLAALQNEVELILVANTLYWGQELYSQTAAAEHELRQERLQQIREEMAERTAN